LSSAGSSNCRRSFTIAFFALAGLALAQEGQPTPQQPSPSDSAKPYDPVSVDPRPFAPLLVKQTKQRVEQLLGQPAVVDLNHNEWYYQLPRGEGWLRVSFAPIGTVKNTKSVNAPRGDGPGKLGTPVGIVGAAFLVLECGRVAGKPVLFMTYTDWQWVQACQAAGLLP
jgi:hypothetical protein